jgi:hypothetical protein
MKHDEVFKIQESIKKESAPAMIIAEATKRKTKVQKRVREDTVEVDKDEIDKVMLKDNPDGNHNEVNMMSVWEDRFDRDAVRDGMMMTRRL